MKILQIMVAKRELFPEIQELVLRSGCEVEKDDLRHNTWEITLSGMAVSIDDLEETIKAKWQPKEVFTVDIPVCRLYFTVSEPEKIEKILKAAELAGIASVTPNGGSENGTKFYLQSQEKDLMALQQSLSQAELPQGCLM